MPSSDNPEVHPAASLVREMTCDEFAALKADIDANGLREMIKLLGGKVIDRRNRLRACGELGIPPQFEDVEADDPAAYVLSLNVARRHLTTLERARAANEEATRTRADQSGPATIGTGADGLPPTQAQAAAKYGVGVRTLGQVRAIDGSGDGELIASVDSGDISIKRAAAKVARRQRGERETGEWKSPIPIAVLRNFQKINRQLVYRRGRELWTGDSSRGIRCRAVFEEELPHDGFLDDIRKLLRALSLYRNRCEVLFEDGRITVRQGSKSSQIALSSAETAPVSTMEPVDTSGHDLVGRCRMSGKAFAESVKGAGKLGAPNIVLGSDVRGVSVTWRAPGSVDKAAKKNVPEMRAGGGVEYIAVGGGYRLAGGSASSWKCSFAPESVGLVDPEHNYDVAVCGKRGKGVGVFGAVDNATGAKLTYWIKVKDVAAHGGVSSVAVDLPGRVMHTGNQHKRPVTAEVIGDQVQLTARLDDDPDRVVQLTVPWQDLAVLIPQ